MNKLDFANMVLKELTRDFRRKSNTQPRNVSDKNPTTTLKTSLSVMFWLVCFSICAQVPAITSFSPSNGPVGTSVIISGANFDTTPANNVVFFGATKATVTAAAADQLTVDVPAGATYAPITVMVNGLIGYSQEPFVVTFSSPTIFAASYAPLEEFTTATSPRGVAVGDLNDDGKPDLVVANGSSSKVSVFKNTSVLGTISYEPKMDFAAGATPQDVAIGDLDGDGRMDLVVANQSDHTLSIFRNTGIGVAINFADKVDFSTGANPFSVAIGDLDEDGKPDLIVANRLNANVSVFKNTSVNGIIDQTSFASKVDYAVGLSPHAVTLGDLDGDGKVDLAVVNRGDNTVSILRNTSVSGTIDASSFAAKVDHSVGRTPYEIASGDLDGDGKVDLAVANWSDQNVSVLKNTSLGIGAISFSKTDYSTEISPAAVAIGDLDGDGKPDMAAASQTGRVVSVLKNVSTSGTIDANSFAEKVNFASGWFIYAIAIGDLDGDHKPDLVVTNQLDQAISVLRHTGSDTATDFVDFSFSEQTGDAQVNAAVHTINVEVEFGTDLTSLVATFSLSAGASAKVASTAQVSETTPNDFTNPVVYSITAGDGVTTQDWTVTVTTELPSMETDITVFSLAEQTKAAAIDATAHTVEVEVFFGTDVTALIPAFSLSTAVTTAKVGAVEQISGTTPNDFTNPVTYTVTAEDGTTTQDWTVTLTEGAPIVAITSFAPDSGPIGTSVVITGENFDVTPGNNVVYFGGAKAVVTAASSTELTVTVPIGATYEPITVLTDGLIAQSSTPFEVTFESVAINAHSFTPKADFTTNTSPVTIEIGDLDGDSLTDLATANGNGANTWLSVFKNTSVSGDINYEAEAELTTGAAQQSVALGDLDGDGKLDLATVVFFNNTVSVFRNISTSGVLNTASFDAKVDFTTGDRPRSVAIGDLDGDGKLDLAVANSTGNTVSVFKNTSTPGIISFTDKMDYATGATPQSIALQDLDEDGKPEMVVANRTHNNLSIFKNTSTLGTISYASKVDFDAGTNPEMAVIGDMDGDDKPDLIVANYTSNTVSVLMNTSTSGTIDASSFAANVDYTTGEGPRFVTVGDLDGNGKQDIAVANGDESTISVLMNTSNEGVIDETSFSDKVDFQTEDNLFTVAIGDLDGDGKNDMVSGSRLSISLFRHTRTDTEITAFNLPDQTGPAIIDSDNHTIAIEIAYTTDLTGLIPTFTLSDAATTTVDGTEQESGTTANDFTQSVIYTVTAEDKTTTQDWTVTVTLAPNTATDITEFSIPNQVGSAVLDATAHTVELEALLGMDVTSLVPTFSLSFGAAAKANGLAQKSGETANDFTNPVVYGVWAEDGTTAQNWTVSVTLVPNTATDFTAFNLPGQTDLATIDEEEHSITVEVPFGTDVTSLVATFTLSSGAVAKVNSTTQTSGSTSNNFKDPVVYTVTAQDGSTTQDWEVTVAVKANGIPTVSPATFAIDEDASVDEFVGQVTAADPDNDDLTYSIQSGNEGSAFQIDQNTGKLSVASSLDFETTSAYTLVVQVEDGNGGTASAVIAVNLNDVDDAPVLGIDDTTNPMAIYPNPVSDRLTIQWSPFDRAILREFSGREVLRSSLRTIDLNNLPTGIYILTLESRSKAQVYFRVVKK